MEGMAIDQDLALKLFEVGAKLIFLDAPANLEFGMDFCAWTVGPKFQGIKFIPPGIHFVYYSATSSSGATGIRSGFFYDFKPTEVLVKRWNPLIEDLFNDDELDLEQINRIKLDVRSFDRGLGTYPLDPPNLYRIWKGLTKYITPNLIQKIMQTDGKMEGFHPKPDGPSMEDFDGGMKFTSIDLKKSYPTGATGSELTRYARDKSHLLNQILSFNYQNDWKMLLGELEVSFVTFLIGQNFCGLEQWKSIIILLSRCVEALSLYPELFQDFTGVVLKQLKECPTDLFVDVLLENNFLGVSLENLAKNVSSIPSTDRGTLSPHLRSLQSMIKKRFNWELELDPAVLETFSEEEDGEYAPVVVEL